MTTKTDDNPVVHVVRAEGGSYADAFRQGGFVGIGWLETTDLTAVVNANEKEPLYDLYKNDRPDDSKLRVAQNVGQIWRFFSEVAVDTFVVTPALDSNILHVGRITGGYYYDPTGAAASLPHRKPVRWFDKPLLRNSLSIPAQHTLASSLTCYRVKQYDEILAPYNVALPKLVQKTVVTEGAIRKLLLEQLLELSADEFELLVTELLTAIGFEANHVGKTGDGGIDVVGTMRVYDFVTVDLTVQVKRYADSKIDAKSIKHFRSSVPEKSHAAFVTTTDFYPKAVEEATKRGFKRIGLINGTQLIDILVVHYEALSAEMRDKLSLQRTLIPIT